MSAVDHDELRAELMGELVPAMMDRAQHALHGSTLDKHYAMNEALLAVLDHPRVSTVAGTIPRGGQIDDDTELAFIGGRTFVNATKHEQVVNVHVGRLETAREALTRIARLSGVGGVEARQIARETLEKLP